MEHILYVKAFLLDYLGDGRKKVEVQKVNRYNKNIQIGDIINFNSKVPRKVKTVHRFDNLSTALSLWDPELICPSLTREKIQLELEKIYGSIDINVIVFELE